MGKGIKVKYFLINLILLNYILYQINLLQECIKVKIAMKQIQNKHKKINSYTCTFFLLLIIQKK